jgi:hypothetical protein
VDRAAKKANGWREAGHKRTPADAPLKLHPLRSKLKRWHKTQTERTWMAKRRAETKCRVIYRHTPDHTKTVL